MKKLALILTAGILIFSLSGCSIGSKQAISTVEAGTMEFNNLADQKSQIEVKDVLVNYGVSKEGAIGLLNAAKDYNALDDSTTAKPVLTNIEFTDYGGADWNATKSYPDMNCRTTSFSLGKHLITFNSNPKNTGDLAYDEEVIASNPFVKFTRDDKEKFNAFYTPVQLKEMSTDPSEITKAVLEEWKNRGIRFKSGAVSHISVVFSSELDDTALVGHTALMVEDSKNKIIYLVEKLGPALPFQVSKFANRSDVLRYLSSRFGNQYTHGVTAPPIYLVNDMPLV